MPSFNPVAGQTEGFGTIFTSASKALLSNFSRIFSQTHLCCNGFISHIAMYMGELHPDKKMSIVNHWAKSF